MNRRMLMSLDDLVVNNDSYVKFSATASGTVITTTAKITLTISGEHLSNDGTLYYSTDRTNWSVWDKSEITITASGRIVATANIYIRGLNNTYIKGSREEYTGGGFTLTATPGIKTTTQGVVCTGCVEALLDYKKYARGKPISKANETFSALFFKAVNLYDASELKLPETNLTEKCYDYMFRGCTKLINSPKLPATTLASYCYNSMFTRCSSLVEPPELPATNLARGCYDAMFSYCTSLTTIPALPALYLPDYCYYDMFYGCTGIIIDDYRDTTNTPYIYCIPITYGGTKEDHSLIGMFKNIGSSPFSYGIPALNTEYWTNGYSFCSTPLVGENHSYFGSQNFDFYIQNHSDKVQYLYMEYSDTIYEGDITIQPGGEFHIDEHNAPSSLINALVDFDNRRASYDLICWFEDDDGNTSDSVIILEANY